MVQDVDNGGVAVSEGLEGETEPPDDSDTCSSSDGGTAIAIDSARHGMGEHCIPCTSFDDAASLRLTRVVDIEQIMSMPQMSAEPIVPSDGTVAPWDTYIPAERMRKAFQLPAAYTNVSEYVRGTTPQPLSPPKPKRRSHPSGVRRSKRLRSSSPASSTPPKQHPHLYLGNDNGKRKAPRRSPTRIKQPTIWESRKDHSIARGMQRTTPSVSMGEIFPITWVTGSSCDAERRHTQFLAPEYTASTLQTKERFRFNQAIAPPMMKVVDFDFLPQNLVSEPPAAENVDPGTLAVVNPPDSAVSEDFVTCYETFSHLFLNESQD